MSIWRPTPALTEPKKERVPDGAKETPSADAESMINLKVPLFSPRFAQVPVALVNDEPILLTTFVDSLAAVNLAGFESRVPYHLSLGEKKRVCLAGVWACQRRSAPAPLYPRSKFRQFVGCSFRPTIL